MWVSLPQDASVTSPRWCLQEILETYFRRAGSLGTPPACSTVPLVCATGFIPDFVTPKAALNHFEDLRAISGHPGSHSLPPESILNWLV